MSYGLPEEGDLDWGDPLNNSVETLHASVQSAVADAVSAKSNAIYAANKVDSIGELDAERVSYALTNDDDVQGVLSATYVQFVRSDNGAPLPAGHIKIKVDPTTHEIADILWEA